MTTPSVSIVIPFFNHQAYITKAVSSIFQQTYHHWELILVDNNSNDGTTEIALEFARKFPEKIRYTHQLEQGIPHARNKGLAEARGKYISFLDVDDNFFPSKLADQVAILETQPEVAMVYGLTRRVYQNTHRVVIQDVGLAIEGINQPPLLAIDWLRILYRLPQIGATLVRTKVARDMGGFDENLQMGNDDAAFHLKLAFHHPIWFHNKEAVTYYRHTSSAGAELNRQTGVLGRYIDTYANWIVPYTEQYGQQTGNFIPKFYSERSLAYNIFNYAYQITETKKQRKYYIDTALKEQRLRNYLCGWEYNIIFFIIAQLPKRYANLGRRIFYRILNLINQKQYPIN
jgi:glycosyltransferase involved in cell wall biosynthesis